MCWVEFDYPSERILRLVSVRMYLMKNVETNLNILSDREIKTHT